MYTPIADTGPFRALERYIHTKVLYR